MEQYVQETGRAGCDGLPSKAILHYANVKGFALGKSVHHHPDEYLRCRIPPYNIIMRLSHKPLMEDIVCGQFSNTINVSSGIYDLVLGTTNRNCA